MKNKSLKLQASSVSRVLKCPGSMTLESRLPDKYRFFAYKNAAEFGTLCHAAGESRLLHKGRVSQDLIMKIDQHPRFEDIFYISDEYAKAVLARKPKSGKLHVEEKFRATICGVDCVAKSDAFYVTPDKIIKFDLKSGNFDYTESATAQMMFAAQLWCYIHDRDNQRHVEVCTVQPAFYNEARRIVVTGNYRFGAWKFEDFVAGIISRQKEFNPGDHCKMCPAILTCKVVKNLVEEYFEMSKKATKEDLNFKALYEKKEAVIAFFKALDSYLLTEMESGKRIPGMYLADSFGHRRWNDEGEVIAKLKYLKDKIFAPRELKTPAQMEKIAGKENIAGLYFTPKSKKVAIRENSFESFAE